MSVASAAKNGSLLKCLLPVCRDPSTNPFNIPADEDIFRHREDDRMRMTQQRLLALQQPVSEKTTLASRMQVLLSLHCL